jgi:hypothetical protein
VQKKKQDKQQSFHRQMQAQVQPVNQIEHDNHLVKKESSWMMPARPVQTSSMSHHFQTQFNTGMESEQSLNMCLPF